MIICPTCGHQVPNTQKFCGNCGSDVRVVAAPAPIPAPIPAGSPVNDQQPAPYAYQQQPAGNYDYGYVAPSEPAPLNRRLLLAGAALILIACCAFACGLLSGLAVPDVLDMFGKGGAPTPTPRPTRESLLPILFALGLA